MRITNRFTLGWLFVGTLLVLLGWFSAAPTRAEAQCQSQGYNAVYGNCNNNNQVGTQGTFAMVDASQFTINSTDLCTAIQNIFLNYVPTTNRIVVDARGVPPLSGNNYPCNVNPWDPKVFDGKKHKEPSSSIILLPAGTITLTPTNGNIPTWTLPSNTRLVGQGPNLTILLAASNFPANTDMIDMGSQKLYVCFDSNSRTYNCPDVKIEHLRLDGNNVPGVSGIVNKVAQELSAVDDVSLINIKGIGLQIYSKDNHQNPSGYNSGPYSNIYFSGPGTCLQISGTADTRGVHGLTCISSVTSSSTPLVLIDGVNNTVEDVYLQGGQQSQQDGILLGSAGATQGNVLLNITGSGLGNVVHLASNASDVTITGVTNLTSGSSITIKDDLPGGASIADARLGMYVLGESVAGISSPGAYSRFTTSMSASAATWMFGTNSPNSSCNAGSLFSCTGTSANCAQITLLGCGVPGGGGGAGQWYPIK